MRLFPKSWVSIAVFCELNPDYPANGARIEPELGQVPDAGKEGDDSVHNARKNPRALRADVPLFPEFLTRKLYRKKIL